MIPFVMLLEVKRETTDALGQVLAMVKGLDHVNLSNGFDIPKYYCIITTLKLWRFVLVTTDGGYTVFDSDELYWGTLGKQVNDTILSYLDYWLKMANTIVSSVKKGNDPVDKTQCL
jgi:hypothetical protein